MVASCCFTNLTTKKFLALLNVFENFGKGKFRGMPPWLQAWASLKFMLYLNSLFDQVLGRVCES